MRELLGVTAIVNDDADSNTDETSLPDNDVADACPYCGGHMRVIEVFDRGDHTMSCANAGGDRQLMRHATYVKPPDRQATATLQCPAWAIECQMTRKLPKTPRH